MKSLLEHIKESSRQSPSDALSAVSEGKRIPKTREGQDPDTHSDLYTDENPKGTIKGLGFKNKAAAVKSVRKIKNSGKKHAHKIQAAIAMEQRARVAKKTEAAAVYRRFIETMKKKTKEMNEEKFATDYTKSIMQKIKTGQIHPDITLQDRVRSLRLARQGDSLLLNRAQQVIDNPEPHSILKYVDPAGIETKPHYTNLQALHHVLSGHENYGANHPLTQYVNKRAEEVRELDMRRMSRRGLVGESLAAMVASLPLLAGAAHAQHTVKPGDTLSALAQKHGTTVADLATHNRIADPNKIQVGQKINFPDKKKVTPTAKTPTKPTQTSAPKNTESRIKDEDAFFKQLGKDEGYRGRVYNDHKGNPTIGYGHMFAADSEQRFKDAGIGHLYQGCKAGTCELPEPAAFKLMKTDYYRKGGYHERTKRRIPNFDNLPAATQHALGNAEYRGTLRISPKAVRLVNQGKGKEAATEFLNSAEYRKSKVAGTGVYKRMERNAAGIAAMSNA